MERLHIRVVDILIFAVSVSLTVFFFLMQARQKNAERSVFIQARGGEWVYPLYTDTTIHVEGPLGITTVSISDGKARIIDSPCPNKTCVSMGEISHGNEWVACLPNAVFVHIEGREGELIDAAAY